MRNLRTLILTVLGSCSLLGPASGQTSNPDSADLSLEDLLNLPVSSAAKNLLDTEYSLPGGPQHSLVSIPQTGRTLLLKLDVGW